jgi:hypothetical protein
MKTPTIINNMPDNRLSRRIRVGVASQWRLLPIMIAMTRLPENGMLADIRLMSNASATVIMVRSKNPGKTPI